MGARRKGDEKLNKEICSHREGGFPDYGGEGERG